MEQTRKFLKKNKNLYILNADKGNVTVAMEKQDYHRKMCEILNDIMTYRIIRTDPTNSLSSKNNDFVEKLFKDQTITNWEKMKLINNK